MQRRNIPNVRANESAAFLSESFPDVLLLEVQKIGQEVPRATQSAVAVWRKHSCLPRPHSCGRQPSVDTIVDAARKLPAPQYVTCALFFSTFMPRTSSRMIKCAWEKRNSAMRITCEPEIAYEECADTR